jgi:hypothetical protein
MSFKFPTSGTTQTIPTTGSTFGVGTKVWEWDGSVFKRIDRAITGPQGNTGAAGATGATGATGPQGNTGPVEEFVASLNGLTGDIITDGLTFAFAGISVGASGITVGGAVSFSGVTGDVKNPSSSSAKIDISVGSDDFTLGRFARTNGIVTIGDVDQVSNGTRIEVIGKNEKIDVYADQKIHLHNGVLFPESGISLGVGLTFPDGTFQSSAHAPHEFVASFNGATGAVEGVNSFNGLTGAVTTTDLTLTVSGISASGSITAEGGIANISTTNLFKIGRPGTGFGSGPFTPATYSFPSELLSADFDGKNPVILASNVSSLSVSGNTELEFVKLGDFAVNSFNGSTGDVLGVANGVATFTISASSAITIGRKTNSLYRFPYNATITNIDVKVNGSGGFTAGAIIAGPDFGNPATSSLTGGTLGIHGITGSSTVFNNTSVTAGGFMFFNVISNSSGSSQAQMFVTYETR